jgi:hypothetical protein
VVGTPQGQVVIKCDKRIPADTSVKLEDVRATLTEKAMKYQVQIAMQTVFKEFKDKAKPQMILRPTNMVEDLGAKTKELMAGLPPISGGGGGAAGVVQKK